MIGADDPRTLARVGVQAGTVTGGEVALALEQGGDARPRRSGGPSVKCWKIMPNGAPGVPMLVEHLAEDRRSVE
jgi:hypothetical protein